MPRFAYLWWLRLLSSMAEPFRRTFRDAFMAAGLPSFHPLSVLKRPAQSSRIHRRERAIVVAQAGDTDAIADDRAARRL
jgi:hypothetical protein